MGWGGRLFEAGRLLTFSAFRMGAYSRWALIRGWALIRINTVLLFFIYFLFFLITAIFNLIPSGLGASAEEIAVEQFLKHAVSVSDSLVRVVRVKIMRF